MTATIHEPHWVERLCARCGDEDVSVHCHEAPAEGTTCEERVQRLDVLCLVCEQEVAFKLVETWRGLFEAIRTLSERRDIDGPAINRIARAALVLEEGLRFASDEHTEPQGTATVELSG